MRKYPKQRHESSEKTQMHIFDALSFALTALARMPAVDAGA
jgi:hypothetical protein